MSRRYPLGSVQLWLQGWPDKHRPRWMTALGNGLSWLRYWAWRISSGEEASP